MLRAILLCFAYMRSSIERCDKLSAAYLAYERDQPCPSSQDATSDDPLSALAFAPECTGLAPPPRACVAPTPAAAIEPAEMRMWEPPIENIAAARFPKYDLGGCSPAPTSRCAPNGRRPSGSRARPARRTAPRPRRGRASTLDSSR